MLLSILITFGVACTTSSPAKSDAESAIRNMMSSIGRNLVILDFAVTCILTSDARKESSLKQQVMSGDGSITSSDRAKNIRATVEKPDNATKC